MVRRMSGRERRSDAPTATHEGIRWLLVVLPAFLFVVSVAVGVRKGWEFETSISAYYGGPLRDVFVGVLVAIGAAMLAYRGANNVEHYNLKGAGSYAMFVALVPTGLDGILDDLRGNLVLSPDGVSAAEYIWALRFSLTLASVLCLVVVGREVRRLARRSRPRDPIALTFVAVTVASLLGFLALAMWQLWVPAADQVDLAGIPLGSRSLPIHHLAAIFLVLALVVVVWSHAWPRASARRTGEGLEAGEVATQNGYRVIFGLMTLGLAVPLATSWLFAPDHAVLLVEWWEILMFAVFWVWETRRQRRHPAR